MRFKRMLAVFAGMTTAIFGMIDVSAQGKRPAPLTLEQRNDFRALRRGVMALPISRGMKKVINAAHRAAPRANDRIIGKGWADITGKHTRYEITERGTKATPEYTVLRNSKHQPILYGVKKLSNGNVLEYRLSTKTETGYTAYFNAWDPGLVGTYRLTDRSGKVLVKRGDFASLEGMSNKQLKSKLGFTPDQLVNFQDSISAP